MKSIVNVQGNQGPNWGLVPRNKVTEWDLDVTWGRVDYGVLQLAAYQIAGQDEKACLNLQRLMLNMLPLPRASERIQIFLTLAEKCKWKIETLMMDLAMDQTGLDLTALGMEDNDCSSTSTD